MRQRFKRMEWSIPTMCGSFRQKEIHQSLTSNERFPRQNHSWPALCGNGLVNWALLLRMKCKRNALSANAYNEFVFPQPAVNF